MCARSSTPHTRKPEVTRAVAIFVSDEENSRAIKSQHKVTWAGPTQGLFGYLVDEIEDSEEWWLDHIHPDDRHRVEESLNQHLQTVSGSPYAAAARIWQGDYRFRRKDGEYFLLSDRCTTNRDSAGRALSFTSVLFDQGLRRLQREEHVRILNSKNHLAIVAENTPSGIFLMDPMGYCTFMNHAAEQITGFTFDEISDFTFHASVHSCRRNGDPYSIEDCPIVCHQKAGIAAKNMPEAFVHKDGHYYDIVYSVSPVGDYSSGGAVIEFRDVTDEKRIERERMSALLENEQQSIRIKETDVHKANMTSFVSFVCHELRNPLQGVTSSAEFLTDTIQKMETLLGTLSLPSLDTNSDLLTNNEQKLAGGLEDMRLHPNKRFESNSAMETPALLALNSLVGYAKELVANIATCASHQALITNNVLDLSRLDAGKVEPSLEVVHVQALGQSTVGMMAARAHVKSINLSLANTDMRPLYLKADATLMSQVLLNLISNAIKFTPENGTITVHLYPGPPDHQGQIILHGSVTDNGLGMTEEEQQRLFQRFSQANRKVAQLYGGSGLGLSISKEIVRVMGGEMHVHSAQGKGSTFSFTSRHEQPNQLELLEYLREKEQQTIDTSQSANISLSDAAENGVGKKAPRFRMVCVAEDNPINLKHLAKSLKILGYDYVLCTNGQEALNCFCNEDSLVDAVIIDMSMPVMDGLEATTRMREFEQARSGARPGRSRTPIIALSGNAMKEQVEEAMAAGTSDYLVKPCKQADLAKTLRHWEGVVHNGFPHKPIPHRRAMMG